MQSYITKIKCKNETEILYTIYKSNYIVHIYSFTTHFFLLKMQLKTRHAIEKTMPPANAKRGLPKSLDCH